MPQPLTFPKQQRILFSASICKNAIKSSAKSLDRLISKEQPYKIHGMPLWCPQGENDHKENSTMNASGESSRY